MTGHFIPKFWFHSYLQPFLCRTLKNVFEITANFNMSVILFQKALCFSHKSRSLIVVLLARIGSLSKTVEDSDGNVGKTIKLITADNNLPKSFDELLTVNQNV